MLTIAQYSRTCSGSRYHHSSFSKRAANTCQSQWYILMFESFDSYILQIPTIYFQIVQRLSQGNICIISTKNGLWQTEICPMYFYYKLYKQFSEGWWTESHKLEVKINHLSHSYLAISRANLIAFDGLSALLLVKYSRRSPCISLAIKESKVDFIFFSNTQESYNKLIASSPGQRTRFSICRSFILINSENSTRCTFPTSTYFCVAFFSFLEDPKVKQCQEIHKDRAYKISASNIDCFLFHIVTKSNSHKQRVQQLHVSKRKEYPHLDAL